MKNLLITLCLFVSLMIFGTFVFIRVSQAQNSSVTADLLSLPAPPRPNPLVENKFRQRADTFYDRNNVPKDDAPIDELLDYWKVQNGSYDKVRYNNLPSERTLQRITAAIEKNPEILANYLNLLGDKPESASFVKRIYDGKLDSEDSEKYQLQEIKNWLTYHSDYFSDELLKASQQVADTSEYVTNQEALIALGKVDWGKAQPIVDRLYGDANQPVSQVLAGWILYQHALDTNSLSDIEKYRAELKAMVENKSAKPGMRDLAMDALSHTPDFAGRDDWYLSLLDDETLGNLEVGGQSYTGLTTMVMSLPPDKYTEKMLALVKSGSPAARNAAVRNLVTQLGEKNPDVVRALLPWLENPKWAKDVSGERQQLVAALQSVTIPESVPGLIAALNEKIERQPPPVLTGGNYNSSSETRMSANLMNANVMADFNSPEEIYPLRGAAISALAAQKDVRAAPALRLILPEVEVWERSNIVRVLLAVGGFSVAEQMEALEAVPENIGLMSGEGRMMNANIPVGVDIESNVSVSESPSIADMNANMEKMDAMGSRSYNPAETKYMLASQLLSTTEVSGELIAAVVDRITELDAKDKPLALKLRKIVQRWDGAGVNALLLRDLKNDRADVDGIVKLLSLRKELREKQPNDIYDARRGDNPAAAGITACLLENNDDYDAILSGGSAEAKTAMLACARLIRARLPLRKTAENLQSPNKMLVQAAESYLESEDSPEAQAIIFALHPNDAKILGASAAFAPAGSAFKMSNFLDALFVSVDDSFVNLWYWASTETARFKENEAKLQKELQENQELLGVYSYDDNFIRIYKDRAVFSWEEDAARYNERTLTEAEFNAVKNYLASQRVNELAPFLSYCENCESKELVMLGRQGGRRIFVRSGSPPNFFAALDRMFAEMRKPPARLHYRLEKNIAGLEIIFADKNFQARTLWKSGADFRVLLDDAKRRKQNERKMQEADEAETGGEPANYEKVEELARQRRAELEFESLAWYQVGKDKLGGIAAAPPHLEYPPARDNSAVSASGEQWKSATPNFEIRVNEGGLYKYAGGQTTKISSGYFEQPLVTPNGRWAFAVKYSDDETGGVTLARINLLTGKEFKIKLKNYSRLGAVAFLSSVNKVLVSSVKFGDEDEKAFPQTGDYFLLNPETGTMEAAKGEFRPLAQQTFRPLQPASGADEFWAAIPDAKKNQTQIGIYNAKTFSFKSQLEIPQILFDSMDLWVDDKENKIYFVYKGQLLGLTLPQKAN